ncbi:molybdopterin synthase large subunit-like [Tropilaelaps mercedesae]|uniref:Molybdopterin synthase large subunit-like n=1 Tax=Tropilaelaps mercedesae TaxID=418985 RepID=A0A1V9XN06_9ACAR|nr:molybdopterin synthase large subunit-like [Tropilaelaps mercedesae]
MLALKLARPIVQYGQIRAVIITLDSVHYGSLETNKKGRQTIVGLVRNRLDVSEWLTHVTASSCGAISIFLGTTRSDIVDGKSVSSLFYEAYDAMALKEMRQLCDKARSIYSVKNIVLMHRLGSVAVKEASVLLICSGAHRQETLRSTEWLINELKSRAPIWKREIFTDGAEVWKANKEVFWMQ